MFALLALLCFILKLFKANLGDIDLVILGFVFIAAHLAFGSIVTVPTYRRRVE